MPDINSIVLYGHPKSGKTFTAAQFMNNALWVVTRKSNVGGFNSWVRKNPKDAAAQGLKPIERLIQVPRNVVDPETGEITRNDVCGFIKHIVDSYVAKAVKGETTAHGIVFDEITVLAEWAHEYIKTVEPNGWAVNSTIRDWISDICETSAMTNLPMVFIAHSSEPKYHEEGRKKGKLKYKGGPAMPVGSLIGKVCALPDAVLQLIVEPSGVDDVKRTVLTSPHSEWERGVRGWGLAPRVEPDLRPLLTEDGWTFPKAG